jgi:hypothetical protein
LFQGCSPFWTRPIPPLRGSGVLATAEMRIGDLVTYDGAVYVLRGLDPMSVPDRLAELEDPATGERVRVPLSDVEEGPAEPHV